MLKLEEQLKNLQEKNGIYWTNKHMKNFRGDMENLKKQMKTEELKNMS